MMKNSLITLSFLGLLFFSACNDVERKKMDEQQAQTLLTEAATAFGIYASTQEEATSKAGFKLEAQLKNAQAPYEYPQISISPTNPDTWPKTITIDYGSENISGIDSHERRGKLVITADNLPNVSGTTWEINFEDYYFDDNKVEGIQTIKYKGPNSSDHPVYECSVTDGVITTPNDKVFYFEQQTTKEWINGYDTHYITTGNMDDLCDDEYKITGTHNGVSSGGYSYNMSTSDTLIVNICCRWIKEGVLSVSIDDTDFNCKIDYGPEGNEEDSCNNVATFTILGITTPITLP